MLVFEIQFAEKSC